MRPRKLASPRVAGRLTMAGVLAMAVGCAGTSGVYDAYALREAKRVVVLPGIGAPGVDGMQAGPASSSSLITAIANLKRYQVTGPGQMRKAMHERPGASSPFSRAAQEDIAAKLDIDLLVLPDVTDYRFTKEWKSAWWYFGQNNWTETTYWVSLNLRFIGSRDGRLIYSGSGQGKSQSGYGPALDAATQQALAELKKLLAEPAGRAPRPQGAAQ